MCVLWMNASVTFRQPKGMRRMGEKSYKMSLPCVCGHSKFWHERGFCVHPGCQCREYAVLPRHKIPHTYLQPSAPLGFIVDAKGRREEIR